MRTTNLGPDGWDGLQPSGSKLPAVDSVFTFELATWIRAARPLEKLAEVGAMSRRSVLGRFVYSLRA